MSACPFCHRAVKWWERAVQVPAGIAHGLCSDRVGAIVAAAGEAFARYVKANDTPSLARAIRSVGPVGFMHLTPGWYARTYTPFREPWEQ